MGGRGARRAEVVAVLSAAGLSIEGIVALPALGYSTEEQERLLRGDTEGMAQ